MHLLGSIFLVVMNKCLNGTEFLGLSHSFFLSSLFYFLQEVGFVVCQGDNF